MGYYLVNAGMSIASLCFLAGLWQRKKVARHRVWMMTGVIAVVISAIILLVSIYGIHNGDRAAAGFIMNAPLSLILAHRILAVVAVILMVAMFITGIRRYCIWHVRISGFFTIIYFVVYISGLLVFGPS